MAKLFFIYYLKIITNAEKKKLYFVDNVFYLDRFIFNEIYKTVLLLYMVIFYQQKKIFKVILKDQTRYGINRCLYLFYLIRT